MALLLKTWQNQVLVTPTQGLQEIINTQHQLHMVDEANCQIDNSIQFYD